MPDKSSAKTFYGYFKESMSSLGLPAPEGVWGTLATATATINTLLSAIGSAGAKMTVTELLIVAEEGATIAILKSTMVGVGGLLASFYVGACIGALLYATQMTVSGKFALQDASANTLLQQAQRYGIEIPTKSYALLMMATACDSPTASASAA